MLGKMISDLMIKPGKSPVFETPDKYGLKYEDVTFTANDGATLSGWLVKGGKDKVIIQSHFGVQCSRCGYTQDGKGMMKNALWTSDIHFLEQAKYLVEAGFSVLMYDLRNHGNSGEGATPWVTWGQDERKDEQHKTMLCFLKSKWSFHDVLRFYDSVRFRLRPRFSGLDFFAN